jgi:hypothetical protein
MDLLKSQDSAKATLLHAGGGGFCDATKLLPRMIFRADMEGTGEMSVIYLGSVEKNIYIHSYDYMYKSKLT